MKLFIDSSALAKRYVEEKGSEEVRNKCHNATEIIVSVITGPEVLSGLNRLRRELKLPMEKYQLLKNQIVEDISNATVVPLSNSIILETVSCLEATAIRTLDAIQLASAKEIACDVFLSADHRQCESAKAIGLNVVQIN